MATFYGSQSWRKLRARHKRHYPTCAVIGCGKPVFIVDHKVPMSVAPERALDPTNIQSLCHACHNRLTAAYDAGTIRGACDIVGNPLDPAHPWNAADQDAAIRAANAKPRSDPMLAARLKRQAVRGRR